MNRCFPRMLARLWALALYGLVMAGALPVAGQGPGRLPFREFGNREGMLSSAINAIHQDGRGLLWVGTEVGLHRYDGHSFQLLELPLPDTTVFSLASDADRLWVGTRGGLLLLGPEGPRPLPQGLPGDRRPVSHLQTDPQGQVWFLVSGVPWRGTAGLVAPAGALPPGTTAAALYVDPVDGAALVCDRHRLWAFQEGRWQAVSAPPMARNENLLAIAREGDGTLWLRTTSGAWSRPGPKPWGFHPLAPAGGYPVITGLGRCRDGSVWLASGEALLKVAGGRWDRIADPLFGAIGVAFPDPLFVVRVDPASDTVWVGGEEDLLGRELVARETSWVREPPREPLACRAKIRSRSQEVDCVLHPLGDGRVRVAFRDPQRAIAPGQAVVFYAGDEVLGGGWISG